MTFKSLSIRQKILGLPLIAVLLFLLVLAGDQIIEDNYDEILDENEICHRISLLMAELLHYESDYVDTGDLELLNLIMEKRALIDQLLPQSKMIITGYRDPDSNHSINQILQRHSSDFEKLVQLKTIIDQKNSKLFDLYDARNEIIQKKIDDISLETFNLLMQGIKIHDARKEFANSLREFASFDSRATLNTTKLYHHHDEEEFLADEQHLHERLERVTSSTDALSLVTEDPTDRNAWMKISQYQQEIDSLRDELYDLWNKQQKLITYAPVTDQELTNFSAFINKRSQEEVKRINKLIKNYQYTALFIAALILFFTSYIIIKDILVSISRLSEGAKEIKKGNHDVEIKVTSRDELGELAATFNDMVKARKHMLMELEESERQKRQVLESTNTIPWGLDLRTGKFTYVGKQAERILGYPASAWVGFDEWANMVHPDDREYAIKYCQEATANLEDHDFYYRMIHENGSTLWVHDIVSVQEENGTPIRLFGFIHDITEQKLAEQEKASLEERLQQAQKMEAIGTLAGGIAHDFNNLLGVILGYAEMAKEDAPEGSQLGNDMEYILQAAYRAKDLVQQILAFSRQSSTQLQLFQPAIIIKEAIKMLRSSIPTTVTIQEKINPKCATILADPTQVHQILMNLCTNAFHALEESGGILAISMDNVVVSDEDIPDKPDFKPGKFVRLTIADNGPGIEGAIIDKIFDPYFTTKETGKGTGMGLSIVHGIVTSYGGMIDFNTAPGEGTTFNVYFPVADQVAIESDDSEEELPTGKERILFVDDEQLLCEMAEDMLSRLGYKVTTRTSSLDALQAFENQPDQFDLVITDQTMPGMTGETLARRMLQIRPNLPIIICTGFSTIMSADKAKSIGITAFALKPLVKKEIAKLIRQVLGN